MLSDAVTHTQALHGVDRYVDVIQDGVSRQCVGHIDRWNLSLCDPNAFFVQP
jgi:hypothetical protein